MANEQNLKPFTGGDDPRRQNGRIKGSKNLSTIVRELESEDFDWSNVPTKQKNYSGSPWRAIVLTAIAKAVEGDIKAMEWLRKSSYDDSAVLSFDREIIRPKIVSDITPYARQAAKEREDENSIIVSDV